MEEKKERQWPPVRRQKKVPKWQRLLRKYWPPIRLGLLILAAVLVIWLCIAGIGKLFGGIGKEKVPEVTEPTEYVPTEEEIQQMAEELLQEAEFVAAGYDYTKASEMLQDFKYYDQAPALAEAVSRYTELDSKLVSYPNMKEVTHVFFHSLIVDTDRAFDDDFTNGGYNQYMTTIQEFLDMIFSGRYDELRSGQLRLARIRVPGKEVSLAQVIGVSDRSVYENLGLHIGVHAGEDHVGQSIGIMHFTPWESTVVAADVALKSGNVEIGFLDRFCGSLIVLGSRTDVQSAVEGVLDFFENVLHFPVCPLTVN